MHPFTTAANVARGEEVGLRLKAIAGVGVALCAAMTSLSIYLGIAEHVYTAPQRLHSVAIPGPHGRNELCFTTTTSPRDATHEVSCVTASRDS